MMHIRDRQLFEHTVLDNGMSVYYYPEDTPFCSIDIEIPVGFAHSVPEIHPGSAHLMEHLIVEHSRKHPKRLEFMRYISMTGGFFNAFTSPFRTHFNLSVPTSIAKYAWEGLYSQVFEPVFTTHGIEQNRGIINSERNRDARHFPASSELGHYISTQWKFDCLCTLEQIFGTDTDLREITPESLTAFHQRAYFDPRTTIILGGNIDPQIVMEKLQPLELHEHNIPAVFQPLHWARQEYHEKPFADISRYELRIGGILHSQPDVLRHRVARFIGRYLVNSVHGPLFQWLRNERGWVYEIGFSCETARTHIDWNFYFPLQNIRQAHIVKEQFWDRSRKALLDKGAIDKEVTRVLGTQVFHFQTLDDILSSAWNDLRHYRRIVTEEEWQTITEACRDTDLLMSVWNEYFENPTVHGTFCATPA